MLEPYHLKKKEKIKQVETKSQFNNIRREENQVLTKLCAKNPRINDIEHAKTLLKDFIYHHPYMATNILIQRNGGRNRSDHGNLNKKENEYIRAFFIQSEESDHTSFEYLKKLLFGQIIASNLLDKKNTFSFRKVNFYIDSNIFFSLLGLHDDSINQSVSEAVNLIKENGGNIKIFEHTREEICQLLQGFLSHCDNYVKNIPVNSIYHTMIRKNYDAHRVMSLITNIQTRLEEHGIQIHYESKEDRDAPIDSDYFTELRQEKDKLDRNPRSIDYDCQSIMRIRLMRRNKTNCYHIHKCGALFLTSDKVLAKFSIGKHSQKTIPEVMTHYDLTGILWLNSATSTQNKFIHGFLSQSVISQVTIEVWDDFIKKLKATEDSGDISRQEIHELLAHEHTKNVLLEGKPEEINQLISSENIQKIREETQKNNIQLSQLQADLELAKKKLDEQDLAKSKESERIRLKIKDECKKSADKTMQIAKILFSTLLVAVLGFGLAIDAWVLEYIQGVVTTTILILTFVGYSFKDRKWLRNKTDAFRDTSIDACIAQKEKELEKWGIK